MRTNGAVASSVEVLVLNKSGNGLKWRTLAVKRACGLLAADGHAGSLMLR